MSYIMSDITKKTKQPNFAIVQKEGIDSFITISPVATKERQL